MIADIALSACTGCGTCVSNCNMDVFRLETHQEEVAMCTAACPAGIPMRRYIHALRHDDLKEAFDVIKQYLPFPAITGRVCFHPCETGCARNDVDEAVNINSLERYVGDYWLEEKAIPVRRQYVAKIAVVGSGPAGLSCAYFLTHMGYPVTVFEAMDELGGMLRYGIPAFRLPRDVLDTQIAYIRDMGVEFKTNTTIGKDLTLEDLRASSYRSVFFAVGAQLSSKLSIEGSDLDGVAWGLEFLRNVNLKRQPRISGDVLVIGGGDVAMDVAATALRMGANSVQMICLESETEMPARKLCVKEALEDGVVIHPSWGPTMIHGKDGKVVGVEFRRCVSVRNAAGAFGPVFDESVTTFIKADMVIFAIGQKADLSLLPKEITRTGRGSIVVDPITMATSSAGVFAGGDAASGIGTASVVESIRDGREAAISIHRHLHGESVKEGRGTAISVLKRSPKEGMPALPRQVATDLPATQRKASFKEVTSGFTREMARREAQRCMTCGSKARISYQEDCMVCFECALGCPVNAVTVTFTPGFVEPVSGLSR